MSFKAVILLSRRDDMTEEEFRNWWINDHAPLAHQLPGARKIVFNACHDTTDIDGISELWFDSEADFVAAYETDLGKRVAADSLAHVRSRTRMFVTEHTVVDPKLCGRPNALGELRPGEERLGDLVAELG